MTAQRQPPTVIARLHRAWNVRDLDALVACFHPDYESLQPLHPELNFRGADNLRHGWTTVFAGVPDIQTELLSFAVQGDAVWTEWRWSGNHVAGAPFEAGGVIIFGLTPARDRIAWARIYTETIQTIGPDWDAVLDEILSQQAAN